MVLGGGGWWSLDCTSVAGPHLVHGASIIMWGLGGHGLGLAHYFNSSRRVISRFQAAKQNDLIYSLKSSFWLFCESVFSKSQLSNL